MMLTPHRSPKPPSPPRPPSQLEEPDETQAVVAHPATSKPASPLFHVLEVTVVSAQDLPPAARTMPTYAVAWVHPAHKLTTSVDHAGRVNPTWNDKLVFRVDDEFLNSETSAVVIQIYCSCRYRADPLIGTVRLVVSSLNPAAAVRFVALQVRRPSGLPQGILNVGVALLDGGVRSVPLYSTADASAFAHKDLTGTPQPRENAAAAAGGVVMGANAGDMLTRSGSLVVKTWGDRERDALEMKLERWRTEVPPSTPAWPQPPRRPIGHDDEINISGGSGGRRKGRRSWSAGALSCFCEVRRHRD